jgi:hypothetical protein
MTGQIWVRSSLRSLRDRLEAVGHPVSAPTVGRLLKDLDYASDLTVSWRGDCRAPRSNRRIASA